MSIDRSVDSVNNQMMNAIEEFCCKHGFYPNRIRMGYAIKDKLMDFYFGHVSAHNFPNYRIKNSDLQHKYMDIPVEVDDKHPYTLEVGYMIKRDMDKY